MACGLSWLVITKVLLLHAYIFILYILKLCESVCEKASHPPSAAPT